MSAADDDEGAAMARRRQVAAQRAAADAYHAASAAGVEVYQAQRAGVAGAALDALELRYRNAMIDYARAASLAVSADRTARDLTAGAIAAAGRRGRR